MAQAIAMKNGRQIRKVHLVRVNDDRWEGIALCYWGNIDPDEWVTWSVACDSSGMLEAAHGHYIVGLADAEENFRFRSGQHGR